MQRTASLLFNPGKEEKLEYWYRPHQPSENSYLFVIETTAGIYRISLSKTEHDAYHKSNGAFREKDLMDFLAGLPRTKDNDLEALTLDPVFEPKCAAAGMKKGIMPNYAKLKAISPTQRKNLIQTARKKDEPPHENTFDITKVSEQQRLNMKIQQAQEAKLTPGARAGSKDLLMTTPDSRLGPRSISDLYASQFTPPDTTFSSPKSSELKEIEPPKTPVLDDIEMDLPEEDKETSKAAGAGSKEQKTSAASPEAESKSQSIDEDGRAKKKRKVVRKTEVEKLAFAQPIRFIGQPNSSSVSSHTRQKVTAIAPSSGLGLMSTSNSRKRKR